MREGKTKTTNIIIETGENQPAYIYQTKDAFTPELLAELKENGYQDVYAFKWGDKGSLESRFYQLAYLLKKILETSDGGKALKIENNLSADLYRILSAACFLINSDSFKQGTYQGYDKTIVDRKLGRI